MATPTQLLQSFAQSVHLVVKGRYLDSLTDDDGTLFVSQVIDWTNMFLDELELEQNADGRPIEWIWTRELGATLGTAQEGITTLNLDSSIDHLVTDEQRYVLITVDDQVVSQWAVVTPADLNNKSNAPLQDMVTNVNGTLQFSRPLKDTEAGGAITGDIVTTLPRMSSANVKVLTTVKPRQLLILGVAKNATLPDIVQGGLSPSYLQRYQALLEGAVARSNASSIAQVVERDDYSGVRGVGS